MFISGLTQGLAKGIEGQTKMAQLREEKALREKQLGMQEKESNLRMKQIEMQNQQLQMQLAQMGQQMLRDGSYENLERWMKDPKDNRLQDEYLQATYVQSPELNRLMSKKLGMQEITDVTFDHDTARLQFKNTKTGQVVEKPLDLFLGEIGYYTKSDAISAKKRTEAFEQMKRMLDLNKTKAETEKAQAQAYKARTETQKIYSDVKQAESIKSLNKTAQQVMESGDIKGAIDYAMALKNNPKILNEIRKDKTTQELTQLKGIENQLVNFKRKMESSAGIMDLVSQGEQAITKYLGSKGLTEQQKQDALEARKIISEGTNIVAQYIKILSGAAFSTEELKQKVESVGLEFGVGKEAALASLDGLITNITDANNYGIGTLPYQNAAYVTGVSARGEAATQPQTMPTTKKTKNEGFKVGDTASYKGQQIEITKVGPKGEILGYAIKE